MLIQTVKAGAAIALFLANVPLAATQIRAEDPAAGNQAQYQTVSFETAQSAQTAEVTNSKNGNKMSSLPESGTMAMLITGICMIGFAARRHSVAA